MSQVRVRLKTNSFNYSSNIEKLHRTKKKNNDIHVQVVQTTLLEAQPENEGIQQKIYADKRRELWYRCMWFLLTLC